MYLPIYPTKKRSVLVQILGKCALKVVLITYSYYDVAMPALFEVLIWMMTGAEQVAAYRH